MTVCPSCGQRAAYAVLEEMGDRTFQAEEAHLIAKALEAQDRADEAEGWLVIAKELGDQFDPVDLDLQARIMARRGLLDDAEELARSALERGEPPVPVFADPRFTLAEILARMDRAEEDRQAAEQSLRCYQAKGIFPLMEKVQALLAEIPE